MVYELLVTYNLGKMVLKLFTTFIVVAAILASPRHIGILPGVIVPVFIDPL